MSLAGDILALGLGVLGETHGTLGGSLTQADGTELEFTGLTVTRRRRTPRQGRADEEEIQGVLLASGISSAPRPDARVTFAGSSQVWLVTDAEPVAGETIGWRLRLVDYLSRDQESE